jgi:hypothetical protein
MAPDRLTGFAGVSALSLAIALQVSPTAFADNPSWNGQYAITFMVGPKAGTSMAVGDPETQHTETYGFSSSCTNGKCVATIVSGPPPTNPTVPQPVQFTWDGKSWSQTNDFQCRRADTESCSAGAGTRPTPPGNSLRCGLSSPPKESVPRERRDR